MHDSMCPYPVRSHHCECPFIERVRADERERIAEAIEAVPPLREPTAQILHEERRLALALAARIARGESS